MKIVVRDPSLPLLVAGIVLKVPVSRVKPDGKRVPIKPAAPPRFVDLNQAPPKLTKPPQRALSYTSSGWLRDREAK